MRRVRASFLLRCIILAVSVGIFIGVYSLVKSTGWTVGSLAFLLLFWFVGVESGLLPSMLERMAVRRAAEGGVPVSSIWFVDRDAARDRAMDRFHEETRDNPTLR